MTIHPILFLLTLLIIKENQIESSSISFRSSLKFPLKQDTDFADGDISVISGIAVSPVTGETYFCDEVLGQIFKISKGRQYLVAGSGKIGHNDGHMLSSRFYYPKGIDFNANGTLIAVADTMNQVVRIIDLAQGKVSTIAGTVDKFGYIDGVGSNARFFKPYDVAFADDDKIFVADTYNHLIRVINLNTRKVETIAGSYSKNGYLPSGPATEVPLRNPFSILFDPTDKTIFISDSFNNVVRAINSTGFMRTVYNGRQWYTWPWGLVKQEDQLLFADYERHAIVAVNLTSELSYIYAGALNLPGFYDGQKKDSQLNFPTFLAFSLSKDILISDFYNRAIRRISSISGYLSTELKKRGAGFEDGPPESAQFSNILDVVYDELRNVLYVADSSNNAIRRISINNEYYVDTLAGQRYSGYHDGSTDVALFSSPNYLQLDMKNASYLYVSDFNNMAIRSINLVENTVSTLLQLNFKPFILIVDRSGSIVLQSDTSHILIINGTTDSLSISKIGSGSKGCIDGSFSKASFYDIRGMESFLESDQIIFSDMFCNSIRSIFLGNYSVRTIAGSLGIDRSGFLDGVGVSARFNYPVGMKKMDRFLYVAEYENHAIREINLETMFVKTVVGKGEYGYRNGNKSVSLFKYPANLAVTETGALYVIDWSLSIRKIEGDLVKTVCGSGTSSYNSTFKTPRSVGSVRSLAFIADSTILMTDFYKNSIIKMSLDDGSFQNLQVIAGDASPGWMDGSSSNMLNRPSGITVNADRSFAYIADSENHLIRSLRINDYYVSTLAGTGTPGNDIKQNPLQSSFNYPQGIVSDTLNDVLYVSDSGNNCIKKINDSKVSVVAGNGVAGFRDSSLVLSQFAMPMGIAIDKEANFLFIADTLNHAIRKIDLYLKTVTTIAGFKGIPGYVDGSLNISMFSYPTKVLYLDPIKALVVLDSGNNAVRMIDSLMNVSTVTTSPDFKMIQDICIDLSGNQFLITDSSTVLFYRIDSGIKPSTQFEQVDFPSRIVIVISISSIFIISVVVGFVILRMKKSTISSLLIQASLSKNRNNPTINEASTTLVMTKTKNIPISVPGYLHIDIQSCVNFNLKDNNKGQGGTAQILSGKLCDPKLIEKFGIVDVAVKLFGPLTSRESFQYELAIMNAIPKSPNLIELMGYSETPYFSILMKFYPFTLRDLITSKGHIEHSTNMKMAGDIA